MHAPWTLVDRFGVPTLKVASTAAAQPAFLQRDLSGNSLQPTSVLPADLDNDGDLDAVSANSNDEGIAAARIDG